MEEEKLPEAKGSCCASSAVVVRELNLVHAWREKLYDRADLPRTSLAPGRSAISATTSNRRSSRSIGSSYRTLDLFAPDKPMTADDGNSRRPYHGKV